MNTIEDNKLMAEFLQWKIRNDIYETPFTQWKWTASVILGEGYDTTYEFTAYELKFDLDWNWLMAVIDKILDISLSLDCMEMYYNITDCIPNLTQTHIAVTDFIKWYNEQNKQS